MTSNLKRPLKKRAALRKGSKSLATSSSSLPKQSAGNRSSLRKSGTRRQSGQSPRATRPSAKPSDVILNAYAMRPYTQQRNRQYWRCVFVGSGCPGFAKSEIGATPEETRSHNHAPGVRPEKAGGKRRSWNAAVRGKRSTPAGSAPGTKNQGATVPLDNNCGRRKCLTE